MNLGWDGGDGHSSDHTTSCIIFSHLRFRIFSLDRILEYESLGQKAKIVEGF